MSGKIKGLIFLSCMILSLSLSAVPALSTGPITVSDKCRALVDKAMAFGNPSDNPQAILVYTKDIIEKCENEIREEDLQEMYALHATSLAFNGDIEEARKIFWIVLSKVKNAHIKSSSSDSFDTLVAVYAMLIDLTPSENDQQITEVRDDFTQYSRQIGSDEEIIKFSQGVIRIFYDYGLGKYVAKELESVLEKYDDEILSKIYAVFFLMDLLHPGKKERNRANMVSAEEILIIHTHLISYIFELYNREDHRGFDNENIRQWLAGLFMNRVFKWTSELAAASMELNHYSDAEITKIIEKVVLDDLATKLPLYQGRLAGVEYLARHYLLNGEFEKSSKQLKEAVAICEKMYGKEDTKTLWRMAALGANSYQIADFDHGIEILEDVYTVNLSRKQPDDQISEHVLWLIAKSYHKTRRYSTALVWYGKILETLNKIYGGDHPKVARCYRHMSSVYTTLGNIKRAEEMSKKALAVTLRN